MRRFGVSQYEWIVRVGKISLLLFILTLLAEIGSTLYIKDRAIVSKFLVSRNSPFSSTQVLRKLGLTQKNYVLGELPLNELARQLKLEPQVESVKIEYSFPDKLIFRINPSEPIGIYIHLDENQHVKPFIFDKDGVIFLQGSEVNNWNFPILSGDIEIQSFQRGLSLPDSIKPLISDLAELKKTNIALYNLISELQIRLVGGVSIETVVYLNQQYFPLIFDNQINVNLLEKSLVSLQFFKEKNIKTQYLDLQSGRASYKGE